MYVVVVLVPYLLARLVFCVNQRIRAVLSRLAVGAMRAGLS